MCGVKSTYYTKLVLTGKPVCTSTITRNIYNTKSFIMSILFLNYLYHPSKPPLNKAKISFSALLTILGKENFSIEIPVDVLFSIANMYVFIPEYFVAKKLHKENVQIFAQTYFSKGIKFFSNQGRWVFFENGSGHLKSHQIHWLHLLYLCSESKPNNFHIMESSNALVFKENSTLILEIIQQIKYGTAIKAMFYDISLEDIVSFTENKRTDFITSIIKPIDLSQPSNTINRAIYTKPRSSRTKRMLPCDVCSKEFDRPSLLKRHIRTHTGERPHICEICAKGFSTSSSLNTHKRIHSGERPHQCRICGKRFTASSNLFYHRLTHSKEKPHKCDICGKSFPTPGNLRSHKYSHDGSSPYKCIICNKMFSKHINLKNHQSLHKTK